MSLNIAFDNSYARLPERFYARLDPTPVRAPALIRLNHALAQELGLDPEALARPEGVAMLSGNTPPPGSEPLAMAYAGHQFGGWVPQLGDGRAILLGEVVDRTGTRRDIQLKGAGPTPFSRMGDGRAALGPVLREYLVSEAMHRMGVRATRALAAVGSGEQVMRETALPGAILTRVARSHIRVGTFQFFAARQDRDALQALCDHAIARHYPEADGPLGLLDAVVGAQARLIAHWMAVGFVHGVMNTDNMSIAGETIDFGPCAFLDGYHPEKVFSSIDRHGRYAFNRQADVAMWNLAQLATSLLPLIAGADATEAEGEEAVARATEVIHTFPERFQDAWAGRFAAKLGIEDPTQDDVALIHSLLDVMTAANADFTNIFRALSGDAKAANLARPDEIEGFAAWQTRWHERLGGADALARAQEQMRDTNPAVIPRNHRIEAVIAAAVGGDMAPFGQLDDALARPFDPAPEHDWLRHAPAPEEEVRQTFCGT
ncbi:hypothetical protein BV394_00530 [Brevirhabdus pacifica]|uniref:Protein nucleotidyltransferase YdiU n=2 Tax=Brevirhabdus pacifica TaxID=1267768 RepID=A0A1U7DES8_9RHOB|nr:YdiU family protein [Brevirhabdus pacifica]APX88403.1 hypothetical protein BV394_00530 [Brevirhabdus pacifica]OWU79716.1 hypothetical protein ATO5_01225 [Loktanella sp. 22II-4b]PJJ87139.1 uncharacterized protein YdiU (UPF0061 family) [Brevirhabdus pacifica]